jgi:uncharacterized delta-60 repeat protein
VSARIDNLGIHRPLLIVVAVVTALVLVGGAAGAGGDLDASFGAGGKVLTDFSGSGSQDILNGVAIQKDGKIVTAGLSRASGNADFALARYNTDGSLDTSFGSGGKVLTDFSGSSGYDEANVVTIQKDGKIVAAGISGGGPYDFALARYNANGSLDTSFGSGGKVLTDLGGTGDGAYALAIQKDGKIVAAGFSNANGSGDYDDFALARYNANGSLDRSFGSGGKVVTEIGAFSDAAYAVAIQGNGKIVAAGYTCCGSFDFALARYNKNGSLDRSFGSGGKVLTNFSGSFYGEAHAVAIQENGKIVAAGVSTATGYDDFALARYNANGSLDTSFGSGGKVVTNFTGSSYDGARAVAIQSNGKIVAAGFSNATGYYHNDDFALARYNADGNLDTSFGSGGKVLTDFSGSGSFDWLSGVAIQNDGKIVAAGYSEASGSSDFALARYLP